MYYYYSTDYAEHGSDYYYEGIAGWVFPQGTVVTTNPAFIELIPVYPLSIWYSTDLGFWYGYNVYPGTNVEQPPNRSGKANYLPQGTVASLPQTCIDPQFPQSPTGPCAYGKQFNPPPAPTPTPTPTPAPTPVTCNAGSGVKAKCGQLGGTWSDETCSCEY